MAALIESFGPFFDEFAIPATVNGVAMQVIFDAAYAQGDVGYSGMASVSPMITLPTAQVPASPVGKLVVVAGKTYTITLPQPDGTGLSTLILELA